MSQDPLIVSSDDNNGLDSLVSRILSEISQKYKLDISQDPVAVERIQEAVNKAKHELEGTTQVEINLPFISATSSGPIHYQRILTRDDFKNTNSDPADLTKEQEGLPVRTQVKLPDRKPIVTIILMVIISLIYILQLLSEFIYGYDLPAALGLKVNELILAGQYWRFVTPVLLHGSILHLGFNMYALYILGRRTERLFGSFRFLSLYLIAGITGNLFSFLFTDSASLGSSTAIFGLLGAEGIFIYHNRKIFGEQSRAALRQIIQVAGINLLIGLSPGIDNWGHIGGLLGGVVFSWFGGPIFKLQGSPPLLQLIDIRPEKKASLFVAVYIMLLIGLIGLIIHLRIK